eukprot:TRINITY_DN4176_c0_g1_i1.p1 TRINITY_DN4176_c0_g1~~TRINITY_DN4176_c0_g1_i1.p1  ORF type:complete len:277 (+),score=92.87 TRINITY_DN4176_c0_g1_i1:61-891(+)
MFVSSSGTRKRKGICATSTTSEQERPKEKTARGGGKSAQRSRSRSAKKKASRKVAVEKKQKKRKKEKEFAWMDSEDEDEEASQAGKGTASSNEDDEDDLPLPGSIEEVESFVQMMRMAPKLQPQIVSMTTKELAAVCQAAARTKYCDGPMFEAIRVRFRKLLSGRDRPRPADIASVCEGLALVNAYDKEVFELAAHTLAAAVTAGAVLEASVRQCIVKTFSSVKHRSQVSLLEELAEQEGLARYVNSCEAIATTWQREKAKQQKNAAFNNGQSWIS